MKVCFVAPGIYPYLIRDYSAKRAGGAELQQLIIGRGLRDRETSVSYIVHDHGQPDACVVDGFTLYKAFSESAGLWGLRFISPRITGIWAALRRADADIYYCRAASFLPSLLALFCRQHGRKFVYAAAHDTDFIIGKELLKHYRDKLLYRHGLKRAARIIVQSKVQQQLLARSYGLPGIVIPNMMEEDSNADFSRERKFVLWVATVKKAKRPLQFVNLARAYPDERFIMIGGHPTGENILFSTVFDECNKLKNIEFLGFQPYEKVNEYFREAKAFVNTSEYEGFPNTFLQAWRCGTPVISYVDPDNIIRDNQLGLVAKSEQQLLSSLSNILEPFSFNHQSIVDYFKANHSDRVSDRYLAIFKKLTECR